MMGFIYEQFGRFAIEGRRESFYIHANYGLEPYTCALSDVKLGACFRDKVDSPPFQVVGQLLGLTLVKPALVSQPGPGSERNRNDVVIPVEPGPNYQPIDQIDNDHPLGRIWRDHPHPEIENCDLGDLIAALEDYQSKLEER
jgi:hypothetical protein